MSLAAETIKKFEGLRLKAYQDGGGVWTIGYGQTGPTIKNGVIWTAEQAEAALEHYLFALESVLEGLIDAQVTENQMAALTSLAYNIGTSAFAKSTLLRLLNAGDYESAADQFLVWRKDNGRIIADLVKRRAAERALFLRNAG